MQREIKRRLNPHVAAASKKEGAEKNPYLDVYVQFRAPIDQLTEKDWDLHTIATVQTDLFRELMEDDIKTCKKAVKLINSFLKEVESLCETAQPTD